jgi:hypothetical protein
MKRFNKSSIALALLLSLPVANTYAALQLTPEESNNLLPFKEISVTGSYLQEQNAADDISKAADEAGAKYYQITGMEQPTTGTTTDRAIVYADIYKSNAPIVISKEEVTHDGIILYPRSKALYYLPFEIVKFNDAYNNTSEITDAASKIAKEKNAYAFYIDSINADDSENRQQEVEVALYKKDAPVRDVIISKAIEGQDAYEITSDAFKVMTPYKTIIFHGKFNNTSEISAAAQKYTIANNAHFYYVKEVSANRSGTTQTVYLNLYK